MDFTTLLVLAWLGAVGFASRELDRHQASDLVVTTLLFAGGLLSGAATFAFLPPLVSAGLMFLMATGSFALCWSRLDAIAARRVEEVERLVHEEAEPSRRLLAAQDRLDQLDGFRGGWIGSGLAAAFSVVLLATGLDSSSVAPLLAAAAVAVVPFVRLARGWVEGVERRRLEHKLAELAGREPSGAALPGPGDGLAP